MPERARTGHLKGRIIVVTFAAILALGTLGNQFLSLALALAAIAVAVILLVRLPRTLSWRLAAVAASLWAVEEVFWFFQRLTDASTTPLITELTYYSGLVLWIAAVLLMPGKRMPRTLLIAALPAVGLLILLLFLDSSSSITLAFPFLEAALVVASLPLLGGSMTGGASDGRVLVVLGFYFRALGAGSFAWLAGTDSGAAAVVLWLMSYVMLGLGLYLELDDRDAEFLPVGVAVVSLQFVSVGLLVVLYRMGTINDRYALVIVSTLAYVQVAVVLLIIATSRAAQKLAASELRAWSLALDAVQPAPHGATALTGALGHALARVPHAQGIEVHGTASVGVKSGYAYPLVAGGAEVGRLYLAKRPSATTVIDTCAPILASRLHLMSDLDRWAAAALTDPLTGLLNRRGLELRADLLMSEAKANESPLSVAMLDIDHFKRVNDVYGHGVGDNALKALANILRKHLRPNDQAVRWGGEEFVVVLPGADQEQAGEILRRVRQELSSADISPVAWPIALSAGVAGTDAPEGGSERLSELIDAADAALNRAKRSGRNRIVRAGG